MELSAGAAALSFRSDVLRGIPAVIMSLGATIRLARPQQWVKNLFVFTALIFAGQVADPQAITRALLAFAAFCLASSAIYFLNDYRDVEEDKKHPRKRTRPLASGELPVVVGLVGFFVLAVAAVGLSALLPGHWSMVVVALYLALNIAYSLGLKHVVILDVLLLASGFVLRILAGATALSLLPSTWLVLCGVTISLFLGFTKRRAEVVLLKERAKEHRRVLAQYSKAYLDQAISIVTAATVVGYVLYTVDERTIELVGSRAMILNVPFVLYGIFRYLYLVYQTESEDNSGSDPTKTIFTDIPLLITGTLWGIFSMLIIFFGKSIHGTLFQP